VINVGFLNTPEPPFGAVIVSSLPFRQGAHTARSELSVIARATDDHD